ncbi:MAG: hypothetical protein KDD67_03140 [Ignavibacteriae bacterium]|nr:hypothetical protein [Ignavibacteriota bacterium]MCB9217174.1 hypothetical protein [Ignavibacteria bacterium]
MSVSADRISVAQTAIVESATATSKLLTLRSKLLLYIVKLVIHDNQKSETELLTLLPMSEIAISVNKVTQKFAEQTEELTFQIRSCLAHAYSTFSDNRNITSYHYLQKIEIAQRAMRMATNMATLISTTLLKDRQALSIQNPDNVQSILDMLSLIDDIDSELLDLRYFFEDIAKTLSGQMSVFTN